MDEDYDKNDESQQGGLREHDPYRGMTRQDTKPDFVSGITGKKKKPGYDDKTKKSNNESKKTLGSSESAATNGGFYKNGASAKDSESNPRQLSFTGKGKKGGLGKKGKLKINKASAGVMIAFVVLLAIVVVMIGTPIYLIGTIDYNLQEALGFTGTVGILEKQAEHIIKDVMSRGEVPDVLAGKLASRGLMVGQLTASGDFVRTNVYVANADKLKDMAVLGHFEVQPESGELAMLYNNRIIKASEFVLAVESDPSMYNDFSEALEIGALYYYGEDASQAIADAGVTRSLFYDWEDLETPKKNEEQYQSILDKGLNDVSAVSLGGIPGSEDEEVSYISNSNKLRAKANVTTAGTLASPDGASVMFAVIDRGTTENSEDDSTQEDPSDTSDTSDTPTPSAVEGQFEKNVSDSDDAANIVTSTAEDTRDKTQAIATGKASQLLNMVVSSAEPYLAAKDFMAIEEPIQRARITGEGPINETMNLLNKPTEVSYYDVSKRKIVTTEQSILTTGNFVAAVSQGDYSKEEAANFSRDRIITIMGMNDEGIIKATGVSSDGQKKSDIMLRIGRTEAADAEALKVVSDSIDLAIVQSNSDLLPSAVGGNRIVEGGKFLSNFINSSSIAAMASDQNRMTAFHRETKEVLARKAEAERATRSPFDISSPYTFMGSIFRNMSSAVLRNNSSTGSSVIGTIADLTSDSVKDAMSPVIADGDDESYDLTFGDDCRTVRSAKAEGDIYCTAQTAISTDYIERGKDDWEKAVSNEEYEEFVQMAMDRKTTVGVKSTEICEKWRERYNIPIISALTSIFSKYEKCTAKGIENWTELGNLEAVATGEYYSFSDGNSNSGKALELAGYALYDQVSSLLENRTSRAAQIRADYYATHPQDNSKVGRLASISGLSKQEVQVALDYADYLVMIARYNPANRFVFGAPVIERPAEPLIDHANQISSELYMLWHGRTEYDDLRNRIRIG